MNTANKVLRTGSLRKKSLSSTMFVEANGLVDATINPNIYPRTRLRDLYRKAPTSHYRLGSSTIK